MPPEIIRLLLALPILIPHTLAGQAIAGMCQPKEPKDPMPQHQDPYPCANRLRPGER